MTKLLRDFTIEELEALPVGARFRDVEPHPLADVVKQRDGGWCREGEECDDLAAVSGSTLLSGWAFGDREYVDDTPDPVRSALHPFAQAAAQITDSTHDDFALLRIGEAYLTAGDFRKARAVLEGK